MSSRLYFLLRLTSYPSLTWSLLPLVLKCGIQCRIVFMIKPIGFSRKFVEAILFQVPASINCRLLEHQREGVKFLYNLYKNNHGGILGDDM